MARKGRSKAGDVRDVAAEHVNRACMLLRQHPIFVPLLYRAEVVRRDGNLCPPDGWAVVTSNGQIHVHPTRRAQSEEWLYVLAHCLLHLGFGHVRTQEHAREWNAACDCYVAAFLADMKVGRCPEELICPLHSAARTEEHLYQDLCDGVVPMPLHAIGTAGPHAGDMIVQPPEVTWRGRTPDWQALLGEGLARAVTSAVNVAGGLEPHLGAESANLSPSERARRWFINSYPLLGALAAAFEIVADALICQRLGISVAAVDAESKEIFMNPAAGLDEQECRFVMAHELLHVGLRHQARRQGRDHYLWNIACDYVINGWLIEMGLGELPKIGVLYDPDLKGESAESIYDRIVTDMRRYRRLATLRGVGLGDMLDGDTHDWWAVGDGTALDDFYRRCLAQGLEYHEAGRGLLPAGLVEEIRALSQPPVPWDVALARWFDAYFAPLEMVRAYARPSRRQSATPDIPRPRYVPGEDAEDGRTFGVILDTSGSMDRDLLARALGTISAYSLARDVAMVRVVFCDAATYDQGYMPPEALAERVKVKGRGGTVLQPAVDLLENADDFPKDGPLLIITDGACDRLRVRREHAFLIPEGRHLPFVPKGTVFRLPNR